MAGESRDGHLHGLGICRKRLPSYGEGACLPNLGFVA